MGPDLCRYSDGIMAGDDTVFDTRYDRAAIGEYSGDHTAIGRPNISSFWAGLRNSFPSAQFTLHHQIGRTDPMMPHVPQLDGLCQENMTAMAGSAHLREQMSMLWASAMLKSDHGVCAVNIAYSMMWPSGSKSIFIPGLVNDQ